MMRSVYSVSRLTAFISGLFDAEPALQRVSVEGEVSNCKYTSPGHIYFSLKDDGAQLPCVMFRGKRAAGLRFRMKDGDRVVVTGAVGVYQKSGRYQMYADRVELQGAGELYARYLALKAKLEKEGLFDQSHKKPIPPHVKVLGVVTSATGAAVQDIRRNALARNPYVQIYLYPAVVQGNEAAPSIVRGIQILDAIGCDCIIIGRGGGSIEDLWAFNEESVARAVYACETPVISAAGHETDHTIADEVADLRVATPTEAAVRAVEDIRETFRTIDGYQDRLTGDMKEKLTVARQHLDHAEKSMRYLSPGRQLREKQQRMADLENRFHYAMRQQLDLAERQMTNYERRMTAGAQAAETRAEERQSNLRKRLPQLMQHIFERDAHRFEILASRIDGLSPVKKLAQGYAYVSNADGRNIRSVHQTAQGERLSIEVSDGRIQADVVSTEERKAGWL